MPLIYLHRCYILIDFPGLQLHQNSTFRVTVSHSKYQHARVIVWYYYTVWQDYSDFPIFHCFTLLKSVAFFSWIMLLHLLYAKFCKSSVEYIFQTCNHAHFCEDFGNYLYLGGVDWSYASHVHSSTMSNILMVTFLCYSWKGYKAWIEFGSGKEVKSKCPWCNQSSWLNEADLGFFA